MKNLSTKQRVFISLALFATLVAAIIGTIASTRTTQASSPMKHRQVNSIVFVPPVYAHKVALNFGPDFWSQKVTVPANWGLAYICDGAGRNDSIKVEDWFTLPDGEQTWDITISTIHLVCDGQFHGLPFNWQRGHLMVVGTTRLDLVAYVMR